ncbi:cold shock domain-containing protein [Paraburkholderia bengalensis]|uniref:Cold shock domain-containing protein n=1 Tax=Paraburkholderia bengalensis TaxID=2747562 RepID=A0ABU8IW87_9BURK
MLVNQVCRVNLNCECPRGPDVFAFAGRKDCRNDSAEFNANAALTNRQRRPFAHFSEILAEGFSSLQEGRKVSLNVKQGPKGKQAADVQPM